jgi:benzoylformate decarboxylase
MHVVALIGDGSMQYAITALWTAAIYGIPVTIVVASNGEYGVLKQFGELEQTRGVPGLDLPRLDIVATAKSYGVAAHEARDTDELGELFSAGLADRQRPTLINVQTVGVGDSGLDGNRSNQQAGLRPPVHARRSR